VSWRSPGRAERIVIYEEDGGLTQYWRGEDGDGNVLWHSEDPAASGKRASGDAVTTPELVRMVESSLQERRRAGRGRKFRL
jgi:hypothetical protein